MFFDKYSTKKDGAIRGYDIHSFRVKVICIVILTVCLGIVVVSLFPAVWVFLAGMKEIKEFRRNVTIFPSRFSIDGFVKTWNDLHYAKYYLNSLILVAGSVVCAVGFNGLMAYGLGVLKPKGYRIINALVMWSLLIPATTSVVALFVNINRIGLNGNFLPLWLAYGANAFYVILFRQFFERMPSELMEAAKLDGCGVLQVFTKIILPLSKPIITVVAVFAMTAAWSDFLLPYLVLNGSGHETVMIAMFSFKDSNATSVEVLRAIVFSIIPPTVLFIIFQKRITDGAASGAIKG